MFEYKGVQIKIEEGTSFVSGRESFETKPVHTINGGSNMIYKAMCKYGVSYALNPDDALGGAKHLIDIGING